MLLVYVRQGLIWGRNDDRRGQELLLGQRWDGFEEHGAEVWGGIFEDDLVVDLFHNGLLRAWLIRIQRQRMQHLQRLGRVFPLEKYLDGNGELAPADLGDLEWRLFDDADPLGERLMQCKDHFLDVVAQILVLVVRPHVAHPAIDFVLIRLLALVEIDISIHNLLVYLLTGFLIVFHAMLKFGYLRLQIIGQDVDYMIKTLNFLQSAKSQNHKIPKMDTKYNKVIKDILDTLRVDKDFIYLYELPAFSDTYDSLPPKNKNHFIQRLRRNPKINYDPEEKCITLKRKFKIETKEELKKLLINGVNGRKNGFIENQELFDSYKDARTDLDELKSEGHVRQFENKKRRWKVVFGLNRNDPIENFFLRQRSENLVKKKCQKIWASIDSSEFYNKLIRANMSYQPKQEKRGRKRKETKLKNIINQHMEGIINFDPIIREQMAVQIVKEQ